MGEHELISYCRSIHSQTEIKGRTGQNVDLCVKFTQGDIRLYSELPVFPPLTLGSPEAHNHSSA